MGANELCADKQLNINTFNLRVLLHERPLGAKIVMASR